MTVGKGLLVVDASRVLDGRGCVCYSIWICMKVRRKTTSQNATHAIYTCGLFVSDISHCNVSKAPSDLTLHFAARAADKSSRSYTVQIRTVLYTC